MLTHRAARIKPDTRVRVISCNLVLFYPQGPGNEAECTTICDTPRRTNQGQSCPCLHPLDTLIVAWGLSYCSSTGGFPWDFPRRGHNLTTNQLCFLSSMWSPVVYKNKEKVMSHSQAFSGQYLARLSVSTWTQDLYSSKLAWSGLLTYLIYDTIWLSGTRTEIQSGWGGGSWRERLRSGRLSA